MDEFVTRILALILFLLPNLAFAQNPSPTQQQVLNAIASNLPTNNANQISALLLRNTLDLMTSAIFSPSGPITFNGPIAALNTVVPASYTTPAYSFNDIGITGLNFPDNALHFAFTITGNSPPTGSGGYVGLNVVQFGVGRGVNAFVAGAIESAVALGGSGHYFGSNPYVVVCGTAVIVGQCPFGTPAALASASGMEVDFFGYTGGSTVYKEGVRITDQSQIQASGAGALSTAITIARIPSAPGYQYAMYLGDPTEGDSFFPLTSTGSVIKLNTTNSVIDSIIDGSGIAGPITAAFRLPDNIAVMKWPSWTFFETPSLMAFQSSGGVNGLLVQTTASLFSGTVTSGNQNTNAGAFILEGLTTGTVTIQPGNANAGTFNFNLPVTAGATGQILASGGGGSSPMTWGPPPGGLSIASFGGVNDGVTDNHAAFVAAVTAIRATSSGCGLIWFGPGTWFTSSSYDVPSCISVTGAGRGITFLKGPPSGQPAPLGYTLIAYGTFNGTGNHGISGVTTYAINTPTEGSLTVTTTTASDASHFTVGGVIAVSGTLHATNFWFPYWTTEVVSADPATGIITLAKTLPFGGSDVSLVQNIIDRPHDITISNLTLMGSGVGAMQANTTQNLTFDNIEVSGTTATGTNNHAYFSIAGSVNPRVTNSKFINYVDCLGCFYANYSNLVISNGQLSIDGGTQDSVFDSIAITDPGSNGSAASGIVVVSDANHNKIVNSHITNVPSGFSGINVGQSNDGTEGANIFCNNTVTGIDTTVTSMIVTSSVGNIICSSVFDTASIAVRLSTNSTGTLIVGNNAINVIGSQTYVADSTSGIINPILPQNFSNFTANSTTPNVGFGTITTSNSVSTSVTNFTGGSLGQIVTLLVSDANTTLVQGSTMFLRGQANYSPPSGTVMQFILRTSGQWYELSRTQANTSQEVFLRGILSTNQTFTAAAPTVAAAQVGLGSTTATAGSGNCPSTMSTSVSATQAVQGCLIINVAGTARQIPFLTSP